MSSTSFDASNSTAMAPTTTDNTKVDEAVGNLAIDLSNLDATWWNNVTSNGGDIRVTDDTGTKFGSETAYSMELKNFDKSNQTGWLFIDSSGHLATSVDKTFRVYVGDTSLSKPADSDTLGADNVWNSNHKGVWHMASDPTGTAPQLKDSTSSGADLSVSGSFSSSDLQSGISASDSAVYFDSGDSASVTNAALDNINPVSIIAIIKHAQTSSAGQYDPFVDKGNNQYRLSQRHTNNSTKIYHSSARHTDNSWTQTNTNDNTQFNETWNSLMGVIDGGTSVNVKRNTNGDFGSQNTDIGSGSLKDDSGYALEIANGGEKYKILDEVRVVSGKLSTNYLSTFHENQKNNSSFFTFGTTETSSTDVTVNASTVILSTTAVAESVTTEEDVTYFASSVTLNASPVDETVTTYKEISGNVTLSGNNVQDAVMTLINSDNDTVVATTTTDANGNYSFQVETGKTYHVTVEYNDGNNKYNAKSKPYLNP